MESLEKNVNFENENSRKAYYREFKKVSVCSDYKHVFAKSYWKAGNNVPFLNSLFWSCNVSVIQRVGASVWL